jgi:hypothetical protein
MFSSKEDLSRPPRQWRTALRNAAELVVAFATLDSYPLNRGPHGDIDGLPATVESDQAVVAAPVDRHGRSDRVASIRRPRGHGFAPARPALCVHRGLTDQRDPALVPARSLSTKSMSHQG